MPDDPVRIQCLKRLLTTTDLDAAQDQAGALAVLRTALEIGLASEDRDVWANLGNIALHLGDDAAHRKFFSAMISAARADGAVMEVLYALNRSCLSQFASAQWSAVRRSADESASLARSIGQTAQTAIPLAWLTVLAAHQGDPGYDELLDSATTALADHRLGVMDRPVADLLRWARAVRAAHDGDPVGSFHHFARMQVPVVIRLAATARLTAAVQAGERARAEQWTSQLEVFARATGSAAAGAAAHHGRALLAETRDAAFLHERSLQAHECAERPYEAACVQLAHGEQLRRAGRRVEARVHLKKALETFRDLGAEPLVDRAGQELRASGETARKRNVSTLTQLTPTELRIAQLVSQGMTNKEVAEQCWVSPRTVAFHLRNVFAKVGVSSRAQLALLDLG